MANTKAQNVWVIDTTGQINDNVCVGSIKLVAGADAATVSIKADSTSGVEVYVGKAAANGVEFDSDIDLSLKQGFYITLTGTAPKAYLYLE